MSTRKTELIDKENNHKAIGGFNEKVQNMESTQKRPKQAISNIQYSTITATHQEKVKMHERTQKSREE